MSSLHVHTVLLAAVTAAVPAVVPVVVVVRADRPAVEIVPARLTPRFAGPPRKTRMNHEIRLSPIRLIDQDNQQIGVIETTQALRMAQEAGLDLVEIQPDVRPPVCKIMDYGKFKFELSKRERSNRAASKQQEMKEVRLGRSLKIDDHDVQIRVDQARGFLMEGHKVQLVQQFRGREMAHRDMGVSRLREICDSLADVSKVETPPRTFGKRMSLILAPDKVKIEALKRKQEKESGKPAAASPKPAAAATAPADAPAPVSTAPVVPEPKKPAKTV